MMNIRHPIGARRRESGLGLVEILVALAVSAILLSGVIQLFISTKRTYRSEDALSSLQEDARFAIHYIAKETRVAGGFGCSSLTALRNVLNPGAPYPTDFSTPIQGLEATSMAAWSPPISTAGLTLGTTAGDVARGGSDILTIRNSQDSGMALTSSMPNTSADLKIQGNQNPAPLADGDIVIITDCARSTMFQVTNFTNSNGNVVHDAGGNSVPGNATKQLVANPPGYGTDAKIIRPQTVTFFIGTGTDGEPALRMKTDSNPSVELVDGVENMQVLYGVDTDNDGVPNRYVTADTITNWATANIVAVRIGLLLESQQAVTAQTDNRQYDVAGTLIGSSGTTITHPADKKMRYVVTTTIRLRDLGANR